MASAGRKPLPFIAWERWQEKLGITAVIVVLVGFFGCLTLWTTFDYPVSKHLSTCRLLSWGYWQPDGKGGSQPAHISVNCASVDGRVIQLGQPLGWTPPDIGSDINIEIVNYRLSGPAYFAK